jgi:hypothetical protein
MKKTKIIYSYLTTFLLLFIFSSCKKETIKINDLQNLNLKGNVKSFKQTSYEAIDKFGNITKGKRSTMFVNCALDEYNIFNTEGKIIEQNKYFSDGKLGSRHTFKYDINIMERTENDFSRGDGDVAIYTYTYDDNKNVLESKINSEFGEVMHKYSYKYDGRGNLLEKYDEGKLWSNYKYDSKGNLIEIFSFDYAGRITNKFICKYYDNGNNLEKEELSYSGDGVIYSQKTEKYDINGKISIYIQTYNGILDCKVKFRYDKKGNLAERFEYRLKQKNVSSEECLAFSEKFKYDSRNNLIEKVTTYDDGSNSTEKFKFDKNNNWIEKITFSSDIPTYIIERHIEYYN